MVLTIAAGSAGEGGAAKAGCDRADASRPAAADTINARRVTMAFPDRIGLRSAHASALAPLAFDDIVALFYQTLALAILALLLLLDVGTFFIGHDVLPATHCAESP